VRFFQIIYSLFLVAIPYIASGQLLINEFSSKGNFEDFNGNTYDWVEIINSSNSSVNLSNYFLTDNSSNLNKFQLPNIILPADSLILFFLSGTSHSNYHANFKLSLGENIIISDSNNIVIDSKNVSTALSMISEGRILDGDTIWGFFNLPTPGESNNSSAYYISISDSPNLSLESGWYNQGQFLIMNTDSLSKIYYTINGDIPDSNDNLYVDTLFLDSTTVISARVFRDSSYLPSKVIDRTYFFNEDNFDLPVFSIITDSLNLWDWNTGIYVLGPNADTLYPFDGANFLINGLYKWSRLEFFDKHKDKQAEEEFDLAIHGGVTRTYAQKSLRINLRSEYTGNLNWSLFSQKPHINEVNNLTLRNGGSSWSNTDRIRDGLISEIAGSSNIDVMGFEPCILYLNGKFWGQYGIREKIDEHYIESNHGIDSDSIDLISTRRGNISGSNVHFLETYDTILNTNPTDTMFYTLIDERFDLDNYIDYFVIETYIQNYDWKSGRNNTKYWRAQNSGKWRYILYDTDQQFHNFFSDINAIEFARNPYVISNGNIVFIPTIHSELFGHILENEIFRCKFISRYSELVSTIFDPDTIFAKSEELKLKISSVIPSHFDRWPKYSIDPNDPIASWEYVIDNYNNYNEQRIISSLNDVSIAFSLDSVKSISFNVFPENSGEISINGVMPGSYPWMRYFFNSSCDNSNINIAIADTGYVFWYWESSNWSIISNNPLIYNDTIAFEFIQDDTITANFRECSVSNLSVSLDTVVNALSSLFDVGFGPYQFQWFLDSVPIEGMNDSIFYPLKTGYYSLLVTDKDSCSSLSHPFFFDCNLLLEPLLTQDTITNSLHINCLGGTEPYSYQWIYNNDTLLDLYDTIHYPLETGYYYFLATDINGCQSLSDSLFTDDCGSVMDPVLLQDSIDNSLYISCIGGTQPYSYQWFIDSVFVDGIDKSFLNIYTYGTYYAIIEDINGCRSFTDTISNKKLEVTIFPNPTNGLINLQFIRLYGEKYTISIFDLHMNILHSIELPKTDHNMFYTHTFNLDINRTGLYLIRLESSNIQISKRFIYIE